MNAKEEIIEHIENRPVKHVRIEYEKTYNEKRLFEGSLETVLGQLDFDYDDGFGGQELYGHIWYEDGTWSNRREYDGSEWWEHHECPSIPND
jgi:hypothetical protein